MIEKTEAKKLGIATTTAEADILDEKQQRLAALKQILPEAINADGGLNIENLKALLGGENIALNNQGYGLNFAGKGLAKAETDRATPYELKFEKAQSKIFDATENIDETENVIIRGDNLEVLKILKANYHSKIKMIYIDPPYNTGGDGFLYKDNFTRSREELEELGLGADTIDYLDNIYSTKTHSGWLAFMYPRLKLARQLLTDDGVIFISIDDNEQAPLKIICDEIFGEENFVAQAGWQKVYSPKNQTRHISNDIEYVLIYCKNATQFSIGLLPRTEDMNKRYKNFDNDPRGEWKSGDLVAAEERKGGHYIIKNPYTGTEYDVPSGKHWVFSEKNMQKMLEDNRIYWGKNNNSFPSFKQFLSEVRQGKTISSFFSYKDYGHTDEAKKDFIKLFGEEGRTIFETIKPIKLIKQIARIANLNKNDIILDFFAGSGTTADAVMQLNAEDGGNRKFILAQLDEVIDTKKEAHQFCTDNNLAPVISSITIERVNRAGEKIKAELEAKNKQGNMLDEKTGQASRLDIGYKVFSLTPRPQLETDDNQQIILNTNRQSVSDKLYNMMVASSKILTLPITTLEENILYEIDNAYYLLAQCESDLSDVGKEIFIDGYAEISLEKWLNTTGIDKENVKILY
ncbi:MAG: site-specific DNA-methyltransferase [Alphaproteobacteria bacterium]|nr:site-specific DNA-methyltransferase [Alphaproteobacteria bacterium]